MNAKHKSGFLHGAVLVLSLLFCTVPTAMAAGNFSAQLVAEHVWLVQGPAGNTLVAHDSDGLILIEGVPAQYADEYLGFVRTTTGEQRIKALVHTHWHPDSSGLNANLAGKGTPVIAHANTRQWLGATIRQRGETILHIPVPKTELPDTTFHDKYSMPFRTGSIELGYLLWAHTDGDIYAWLPQQNLLFTGPVMRQDGWSAVDESTNGFIGGLMDSYDLLTGVINDTTTVVPASGAPMSRADFDAQVAMYKALYTAMVEELRKSHSAQEVVIANPAAGLKPEWGDPSEFLDQGFRSFYGHLRYTRHVGVMP